MTQEEKSKAYDEALEQAKRELNTCGSLDCDAARQIFRFFPQLRESNDERIRKYLIEELKATKSVGELKFIIPHPTREECIAYLEKQKENPKSADSIPSDCASDAKCEDRSPKHSDSDGIDIRDTPAYWRGWDDAMKQKEQKPVERHLDLTELLVPQRNIEQKPNSEFDPNSVKNKSYLVQIDQWSEEDEHHLQQAINALDRNGYYVLVDWLKSLRPSWKPSEEKKKETIDGVDIGYGLETAIDILENGFTHYQTDDGEYERKQALDVLIFLLNETRKKEDAKLWSKDIVESIVTWATEKLQLYSMKESTPYVEAVKNNAQKVLDWTKEQWPIYYGWRPSEEQMEAIDRCVDYLEESDNEDAEIMESLQEQLHKLM